MKTFTAKPYVVDHDARAIEMNKAKQLLSMGVERTYTRADFVRWGSLGHKARAKPHTLTPAQARRMVRAREAKRKARANET